MSPLTRLRRSKIAVVLGLGLLAGCASLGVLKTPDNAVRYPHLPVSAEELANAKAVLVINPKDPLAVQSRYWLAQDEFNRGRWPEANKRFSEIFRQSPHSEWAPAAAIMAARCRQQTKNFLSALSVLNDLRKLPAGQQPPAAEALAALARQIINDDLAPADLEKVRAAYPESDWAQQALFVTGKRTLDAGQPEPAGKIFSQFLMLYPQSEFAPVARALMEKTVMLVPVNRTRLGVILPITGPFAPYGQAIQRGLELALAQLNAPRPETEKLGLVVLDSEANTEAAYESLLKLAETEKVFAVIGPALSASVRPLLPEIDRLQLPLISPSASDPGLAGCSPYFFRYLLTNEQQGEAMAERVVLKENLKRIGVLNSRSRYDQSLADAFCAKVQQLGGEIVARAEYDPGTTDFKAQMLALGGVDPGRMKNFEVEERKALDRNLERIAYQIDERTAPQALKASLTPIPDPKATPIPDVRAAILRFAEEGDQTQAEQLGKLVTERFSYSLAAKPGLEVLTQRKTQDALQGAGLNAQAVEPGQWSAAGSALDVAVLVTGKIKQKVDPEPAAPDPGQPVPVAYTVTLVLADARGGKELKRFTFDWVKHIAPQANVRQVEAVYLPVSIEDALLIGPQLPFYDLTARIFGPDAWVSPRLLREGGESLGGAVIATGYWPESPEPAMQAFVKRFEETYSEPPSLLSAQAYDTMSLVGAIAAELSRGNAGRAEFADRLRQTRDFRGATGKAWVESNGEIRRDPIFLHFEGNLLKKLD